MIAIDDGCTRMGVGNRTLIIPCLKQRNNNNNNNNHMHQRRHSNRSSFFHPPVLSQEKDPENPKFVHDDWVEKREREFNENELLRLGLGRRGVAWATGSHPGR